MIYQVKSNLMKYIYLINASCPFNELLKDEIKKLTLKKSSYQVNTFTDGDEVIVRGNISFN